MTDHDATVDETGLCVLTELLPDECGCRFHATPRPTPARGHARPSVHEWCRDDDVVVAAVYFNRGTNNVPAATKSELAEMIGCSEASVAYKLGNLHSYVTGRGALKNGSAQMRAVVEELRFASVSDRQRTASEARRRLRR
jgi:hypothetical protein